MVKGGTVTFFHPAFNGLGGAELLAMRQAAALRDAGVEVGILTFGLREDLWRRRLQGIPTEVLPRRAWTDLLALGSRHWKWRLRARRAGPALARAGTVLAHNPPAPAILGHSGAPGRRLWYCHEAPWRLHPLATDYFLIHRLAEAGGDAPAALLAALARARDGILDRARGGAGWRAYDLAGVAGLDGILANSAFCAGNLARIYGRADIRVVPPIVDMPVSAHRPGLDPAGLQVLTLARLELLKNVETVLRGFARFCALGRGRPVLRVVGDGRERPALEALARELDVAGQVEFHGWIDPAAEPERLAALFAASDLFALLPLDESFGLVYPEAAARGLLLAGPDHGGPAEILDGLGWTLPALSPEALCQALDQAWNLDEAELQRRRERADRACRQRYGEAAVLPLLLEALRKS